MITRKGSVAYEAGLICEPNLDTLLNRQKMIGFDIFNSGVNEEYFSRSYIPREVIKPISKKFDW